MKTRAMTLIILTPGFPGNEADSTCLPSQQLFVRSLNKLYPALQIIILSFEYPFRRETYLWHKNMVISMNGWKKGRMNKLLTYFLAWQKLSKLKKRYPIIGLLSFWCTGCALLGKYFARFHGLPHYAWILGQDAKKENHFVRWIKPEAGELIALSDFLANEFFRNHSVKPAHIIPNGIEPSMFSDTSSEKDIDLLAVGSLIPLKQHPLFIAIVYHLSKQMPDLSAVICGKGPEKEKLLTLIEELNLQDNIQLKGELPHEEVLRLMQRTRVLLHPSNYEGYSTVCLEALYAGAEVVSFCNPKVDWIRNWYIVKDVQEMIKITEELLLEENKNGTAVLLYTLDDQAKAVMQLYNYGEKK
ncbi:MAG: glycosyltransferase [Chitinophagales bacterium]